MVGAFQPAFLLIDPCSNKESEIHQVALLSLVHTIHPGLIYHPLAKEIDQFIVSYA
jgi:hypothetical protein